MLYLILLSNNAVAVKIKRIKKKDFKGIQKNGKNIRGDFLALKFAENRLNYFRVSCVVSKKVERKAVKRNKIKKRLREAVRRVVKEGKGYDFIFFAKPKIKEKKFEEILREIDKILKKAGLY